MPALPQTSAPERIQVVQSLLRARKLDRTLTTEGPATADAVAPFEVEAIDRALRRGIPRGQVSEIVGPVSSGRTSLAWAALAAATARGEWVALVDTFDRFDPETASDAGIELSHLLWVRGQAISKTAGALDPAWVPGARAVSGPGTLVERTVDRAIKALNLIVQSGVCTMVVLDLIDVPAAGLARVPPSTWLRIQRAIEGGETAVVLLAATPVARSAGGLSIATGGIATGGIAAGGKTAGGNAAEGRVRWAGTHDRSRRLAGLSTHVRAASPRGFANEFALTIRA
jgi:hypothetical protein